MENVEDVIKKLCEYYQVSSITELASKMRVPQPTISNWKRRNSINSVKKRCRELDIYKIIFKNTPNKNAKDLIDKLMEFYEVDTLAKLGEYIKVSHPTLSRWIKDNSIDFIKKKSRELGIYNYLFDDFEVDLFQNLEDYPYEEKQKILYQNCKKYNIQTTSLSNLRLLYLIQELEKYSDEKELEKTLKDLLLNSNPLFKELDKNSKNKVLEILEKNIKKFEEENK